MRIPRLYLQGDYVAGEVMTLTKDQAHYVLTVLRLKNQHIVDVFNGQGLQARGTLVVTSRRTADLCIESLSEPQTESPLNTVLVQSISRGDRMDTSIQKAVELGVTQIQPIFSERCEVKLNDDKLEKRRSQWQSIAISACEQSGRSQVPEILPIQPYPTWLQSIKESNPFGLVMDPYAKYNLQTLTQPALDKPIYLLVGPEGGLTEQEVEQATSIGLTAVQLGPRVLRTETAGPAILAGVQIVWGDL